MIDSNEVTEHVNQVVLDFLEKTHSKKNNNNPRVIALHFRPMTDISNKSTAFNFRK